MILTVLKHPQRVWRLVANTFLVGARSRATNEQGLGPAIRRSRALARRIFYLSSRACGGSWLIFPPCVPHCHPWLIIFVFARWKVHSVGIPYSHQPVLWTRNFILRSTAAILLRCSRKLCVNVAMHPGHPLPNFCRKQCRNRSAIREFIVYKGVTYRLAPHVF